MTTRNWTFAAGTAAVALTGISAWLLTSRAPVARAMPLSLGADVEAALVSERWDDAARLCAPLSDREDYRAEAAVIQGYALLAAGRAQDAAPHFLRARHARIDAAAAGFAWARSLAEKHSASAAARWLAADAAVRTGDRTAALRHLDAAMAIDSSQPAIRLTRAIVRLLDNDVRGAIEDLDAAKPKGSIESEFLVARAMAFLAGEDPVAAAETLDRAIKLCPRHAIALDARGVAHARLGEWARAIDDFAAAFRQEPGLAEARHNWQLSQKAASAPGSVIAAKSTQWYGLTIVSGADAGDLRNGLALASEAVKKTTGRTPIVVRDMTQALNGLQSGPVILELPDKGIASVAGEKMLATLKSVPRPTAVSFFTIGAEAAENGAMGIHRYLSIPSSDRNALIRDIQVIDPSDHAGLFGKLPLVTNAGMKETARMLNDVAGRGVPITVYPVEGKVGFQHLGNVKTFLDEPNLRVVSAYSKAAFETSLRLSPQAPFISPGVSVSHANDKVSLRTDSAPRDFTIYNHDGTRQIVMQSPVDMITHAIKPDVQIKLPVVPQNNADRCGGVSVGPVNLGRGAGGQVVFKSGANDNDDLLLVNTLFGAMPREPISGTLAHHE